MINDFNRDYNFEQERVNEDFLCCFFLSAFVIQIEKFLFDLITVRERPRWKRLELLLKINNESLLLLSF